MPVSALYQIVFVQRDDRQEGSTGALLTKYDNRNSNAWPIVYVR